MLETSLGSRDSLVSKLEIASVVQNQASESSELSNLRGLDVSPARNDEGSYDGSAQASPEKDGLSHVTGQDEAVDADYMNMRDLKQ